MVDYILCLLGIFIYFLNRYANKQGNKKPSLRYWIGDNFPELLTTLALNIAILIILHLPGTSVDMNPVFSQLPFGLSVAGLPTLCFLLGLGLTAAFYKLFKSKANPK